MLRCTLIDLTVTQHQTADVLPPAGGYNLTCVVCPVDETLILLLSTGGLLVGILINMRMR